MLGHLLQVTSEVACEVANFVPRPGIRIERQAANGNPAYKIAGRSEQLLDQGGILGEEKNIAHQTTDGFRGWQLIDPVLWTLLQKKEGGDRSRAVFPRLGQLSGERGAECRVTLWGRAQVGNFVGSKGAVGW